MKKVLLFCVLAMALASCAPKKTEEAPKTGDSLTQVKDTTVKDTTVKDTTVKK